MDYYMTIKGVTGDSTNKEHKGSFELDSYSIGVTRGVTPTPTALTLFPLSISLRSVLSVPLLLAQANKAAVLNVTIQGRSSSVKFDSLKIVFSGAVISDMSTADSGGGDVPQTSLSFVYKSVAYTFTPTLADGTAGTPVTTTITATP
ncbi:MAG: type VI secretion system tube protein Hcp [Armatimonadetes bacterium]|nr:type VI secretion system tube protein Hcp [Armatimonadota bacterium]